MSIRQGHFIFLVCFIGCIPGQKLEYKNLRQSPNLNSKQGVLRVNKLADKRREFPGASSFLDPQYGGDGLCRNYSDSYKELDVPLTISRAFVQHLTYRRTLSGVVGPNDSTLADYELDGSLNAFYAVQKQSVLANISSPVGDFNRITAWGVTSKGKIDIVFGNLTLRNVKTGKTTRLPPIEYRFLGELPIDSRCYYIFRHAETHLTLAFNALEEALLKALP